MNAEAAKSGGANIPSVDCHRPPDFNFSKVLNGRKQSIIALLTNIFFSISAKIHNPMIRLCHS
jgi:hypothetical protein